MELHKKEREVNQGYTPKERAINALTLQPPLPGKVPAFELEFQLTEALVGKAFYRTREVWEQATVAQRRRMIQENGDLYIEVAERLDYAIIMIVGPHDRDMDLAVIKRLAGDKVCLLGGVQCSLLQTGTEEEIIEQCKYVLRHGLPGGGYIYGTTNVAFKGLPLERYLLILEMRERYGWYDEKGNPCPELYV